MKDEDKIESMTELLFEQLFGKYSVLNITDMDKKAVIRTALTNIVESK